MKQRTFSSWLHTELPIIQAPMAGVQDSKLAIAVSEAGGLGSIPCGMLSKERIVEELESITSATDKPYNLNFFCHLMPNFDQERQAQWRNRLAPYFEELKLDIAIQPSMQRACHLARISLMLLKHLNLLTSVSILGCRTRLF